MWRVHESNEDKGLRNTDQRRLSLADQIRDICYFFDSKIDFKSMETIASDSTSTVDKGAKSFSLKKMLGST